MKSKKTNFQAALLGAAIVGIPFGIWSYLLAFQFCVECDASISFAVVLPAVLLGCPWSLIWLIGLMQVQMISGVTDMPQSIMLTGYVVCVALNGALFGFLVNKKRNENA